MLKTLRGVGALEEDYIADEQCWNIYHMWWTSDKTRTFWLVVKLISDVS